MSHHAPFGTHPVAICLGMIALAAAATATSDDVAAAMKKNWKAIPLRPFADSIQHARGQYKNHQPPYELHDPDQIVHIAENMLAFQTADGGWPKNMDWQRAFTPQELNQLRRKWGQRRGGTLDNRTTWTHVRYLAQVHQQTGLEHYANAARRGLLWIIRHQDRRSGGWAGADIDAITFNDDVMTGALRALHDAATDAKLYSFLDERTRQTVRASFERGLQCVLRCQVRVDGRLTAWGQQHSHETYEPIWARGFEPPAITPCESTALVRFLMELDDPSPEVIRAIDAAVAWMDRVKISGLRVERIDAEPIQWPRRYCDFDVVEVRDPNAPPIWTRFYDPQTERPIFCTRDRRITTDFTQLSRERRTGYGYHGDWPASLIAEDYPAWKRRTGRPSEEPDAKGGQSPN